MARIVNPILMQRCGPSVAAVPGSAGMSACSSEEPSRKPLALLDLDELLVGGAGQEEVCLLLGEPVLPLPVLVDEVGGA